LGGATRICEIARCPQEWKPVGPTEQDAVFPDFFCLPSPVAQPPTGSDWVHEIKHDGKIDKKTRSCRRINSMASIGNTAEFSPTPKVAPAPQFTLPLYTVTLFLSALLIFAIQPMFTKMVLPRLGGSPSVWSVAMVVFQTALFLGYVYSHLLVRGLKPGRTPIIHAAFLAVVATTLPLGIAKGFGTPPEHWLTLWLFGLFFVSIGLPFTALAASAPLLQSWFVGTGHKQAANPYVLYAASNLGSFAALIAYPFLIEPLTALQSQFLLWSLGFYALVVLFAAIAYLAAGRKPDVPQQDVEPRARPTASQCLSWTFLAAIPSALVIAVTAHISADVAAAPFLWVLPLALYLLTFVAVFRERPWVTHVSMQRLLPLGVAPLVLNWAEPSDNYWLMIGALNLYIFVLIALACHGEAYRTRPHRSRLTDFYLWISFGGAFGGIFAGLIAPNIFNNTHEYSILLAAAMLILPVMFEGGWQQFVRDARPAIITATILAIAGVADNVRRLLGIEVPPRVFIIIFLVVLTAVMLFITRRIVPYFGLIVLTLLVTELWQRGRGHILTVRNFFGVHQVVETTDRTHYLLFNGTTVHGLMRVRDASGIAVLGRPEPSYNYYVGGAISETIEATRGVHGMLGEVATIGLGVGSVACHRQEGEQWTFFEIDPEVVRIARDPKLFRFLLACAPTAPIVLGDGRLMLAATSVRYNLIVLDAFSSDAIPVHLLTREAFASYLSRLAPHGVIVAHVSNRHLELVSVVGAVAAAEGLVAYVKYDRPPFDPDHPFRGQGDVVALARASADFGDLPTRKGWHPAVNNRDVAAWTDDYSNVLGALVRKKWH
jgi:hypothetical protein